MIYATHETQTKAYLWNTGEGCPLEKGTQLSDYTGIQEEVDEVTLQKTLESVYAKNMSIAMEKPALMMVTTGFYKSIRVWVDQALLVEKPEINDPKKGFEYYSED